MEKRAYSRLERDGNGVIRVVFYDAETSMPVTDLTGYSIVALDEKGQALPINAAPVNSAPIASSQANLPSLSEPSVQQAIQEREGIQGPRQGEGGAVAGMDLEPTNRFVGPGGLVGLALGDEEREGNKGWRNNALTTGLGIAASAAIGGLPGLAVGTIAKGVVNSDKFKDTYNDRGQLNAIGVGPGRPKAPEGPRTEAVGLGVYPDTQPDPPQPQATQSIGQQRTNIPSSAPPIDGGYQNVDMRQAPSMSAFNRRDPQPGTFGTAATFDRTGLNPGIGRVVDSINEAVPGVGINSGYRSPERNRAVGGANSSQHIQGNAVDINTRGWSNEQKRDALEAAVQSGARGIGIYSSGNSIHVDTRREPTTWGPSGYTGSKIESMPEWSRDTLRAMYGAGPDGQVGPRIGPSPKSREQALSETPIARSPLGPVENDLAFTSRPQFKDEVSTQRSLTAQSYATRREHQPQSAAEFLGSVTKDTPAGMRNNNPGNLKYSGSAWQENNLTGLVGPSKNLDEGDPQAVFSSPQAGLDSMSRLAVGKFDEGMTTVNSLISGPKGWTPGKQFAADNVAKSMGIKPTDNINLRDPSTLKSFMGGLITQEHGPAGRAYSSSMIDDSISHTLGFSNVKGRTAREQDDDFTQRSLQAQAGRNVENIDKTLSGDRRTSVSTLAERERAARERQVGAEPGSLEGSRYSGVGLPSSASRGFASSGTKSMSTRTKDDTSGSNKNSSNKSSSGSGSGGFANSKSMSTRSKDDNVGSSKSSSNKSSSSSSKSSRSGGVSSSSASRSGDGFASRNGSSSTSRSSGGLNTANAKGMSERSKDDKDSSSKSSSGKSSSGSSGGGKKK